MSGPAPRRLLPSKRRRPGAPGDDGPSQGPQSMTASGARRARGTRRTDCGRRKVSEETGAPHKKRPDPTENRRNHTRDSVGILSTRNSRKGRRGLSPRKWRPPNLNGGICPTGATAVIMGFQGVFVRHKAVRAEALRSIESIPPPRILKFPALSFGCNAGRLN